MSDVNRNLDERDEHVWASEQMATALVGALAGEERARFERHVDRCDECRAMLAALRTDEEKLTALFESARPAAGLEDRIIRSLRTAGRGARLRIHPSVSFVATGIAATIVVGGFGLMVNSAMNRGGLPQVSNLKEFAQLPLSYSYQNPVVSTQPSTTPASGEQQHFWYAQDWSRRWAEPNAEGKDGQNVRYSDGHADWGKNPFVGAQRDNTYGLFFKGGTGKFSNGRDSAWDAEDSILVPQQDQPSAGQKQLEELQKTPDTNVYFGFLDGRANDKEGGATLSLAGKNVYRGGTVVTSGGVLNVNGAVAALPGALSFKPTELASIDAKQQGAQAAAGEQRQVALGHPVVALKEQERLSATGAEVGRGSTNVPALVAQAPANQPAPSGGAAGAAAAGAVESAPQPSPPPVTQEASSRKIIRTGAMEFEVDRFDSAFAIVSKIVSEAGGYIGSTNSEKLPNGKVRGTVTVRVPPERLDTVVLQLRGMGDLKSQKLDAQDVSKLYHDLDGELKAARAMEARLLEIIKTGKGEIKDLLAAEKELGVWRGKIEKLVGEMKYYDNQVALSTLSITLYEKDVNTVAAATETESVDAGVEAVDVEKARAEALKAIDEAKGRVLQSELKKHDAGQFAATIVAEVAPDRAGPVIDRIKQLGRVARLEVQRKQSDGGSGPSTRVERKNTRINLSLYNLANVAPRATTAVTLAVDDAEAVYRAVLARVEKAGGRVVNSNLARPKSEQISGTISFEVPAAEADAITAELKAAGEALNLSVTENPDTNNTTTAKRGFTLQVLAVAGVAPRETTTISVAATNVGEARNQVLEAARVAAARILGSQLNESDRQNVTASLDLEVKRDRLAEFDKAMAGAGDVISRSVNRPTDTENTVDSKVRLQISLTGAERLAPRLTTTMAVEVRDVEAALADVQSAAATAGGKVAQSNLSKDRQGRTLGRVVIDVPHDKANDLITHTRGLGTVRVFDSTRNQQAPEGKLARARIEVTFGNAEAIVEPGRGVWASVRNALATSAAGLLWSLQIVIIGLCFVLPWVLLLWGGWKLIKRSRRGAGTTEVAPA